MSIGVFDSGIGGLTVLKEIRKVLPDEKIYYLGDTARVPYGEKTKELIIRYSKEIVEFLLEKNVSAIVVACNTATALALKELKETFKIPLIGVIDFKGKVDTLILGCTHYPLLKDAISKIYPDIKIVDPAKETALDLKEILEQNEFLKNDAKKDEEVKYYVTDGQEKFKEIGIMFLEEDIPKVELVKL